MITVKTSKELGEAIKNEESSIYIEGDLKNKVVRIKFTGKLAWAVAGASIAGAVLLYLLTPAATVASAPVAGAGGAVTFTGAAVSAGAAMTILGIPATTAAIAIAVAAGGYGAIISLRDKYKISRKDVNGILLEKK